MKNIKHLWTIYCKNAVIDQSSNSLSIFDVLERWDVKVKRGDSDMNTEKLRVVIPEKTTLVTTWISNDDEAWDFEFKVDLVTSTGISLGGPEVKVASEKRSPFHRTIIKLEAFPVEGSGLYFFKIKLKKNANFVEIAEIPIEVIINEQKL